MSRVPIFGVRVEGCPYIIRPSAYAVVRNEEAALAVVRTPRGYYLLGGGIEGDETPEHAIQREIREEAGLIVVSGVVIGEATEIVYSAEENACFEKRSVFLTAQVTGKLAKRDHDHQLIWLGVNRAIGVLSRNSHRWALQRFAHLTDLGCDTVED